MFARQRPDREQAFFGRLKLGRVEVQRANAVLDALLGLAQFDQGHLIVELLLDAADGGQTVLERGALLHHPLGALGIVPELDVLGELVQFGKPAAGLVDIKDASSAARPTA
jgi:hypothetical protein